MFNLVLRYKDSFFYLASNLVIFPITLITSPLFALNLDSKDFAAIGFFSNLQVFLLPVMTMSFLSYYMTGYHQKSEDENNYALRVLFSFLILLNIFISSASYFFLKYYLDHFNSEFNSYPLGLIVILSGVFSISLSFWNIRLRFERKSAQFFYLNLLSAILAIGLGLLLVIHYKLGAIGKLLPTLIVNGVFFLIFYVKYIRKLVFNFELIRKAIAFCYPLVFIAILSLPVSYIDKFILERLDDVNEFALYNIADNISGYFGVFSAAILQTFEPDVFKLTGKRNKESVIKLFLIFIITLFLGCVFFVLISDYAVDFLTAGKYTEATKFMIPMLIYKMLEPLIYFLGFVFISLHLTKLMFINKLLLAVISIPIYLKFITYYSFLGAPYGKIVIFLIAIVLMLIEIFLRNSSLINALNTKKTN